MTNAKQNAEHHAFRVAHKAARAIGLSGELAHQAGVAAQTAAQQQPRVADLMPGPVMLAEIFIPLHTVDEWESFYDDNRDAIEALGGFDVCFELARTKSLLLGGGAAPMFRIGFVE